MEASFWHERWEANQIAFHEGEANFLLVKYFKALSLEEGARIFLPLCGKTLDIAWLLSNGYSVVGAELSEKAIDHLFVALGVQPKITVIGDLKHYSETNIDIFVGDIFHLSNDMLGTIDAVYDRAALVALPEHMRSQYVANLMSITNKAPQLLITFVYDQSVLPGPPFSISDEEVKHHYGSHYDLNVLESVDVPGGLKRKCEATENAWLLMV